MKLRTRMLLLAIIPFYGSAVMAFSTKGDTSKSTKLTKAAEVTQLPIVGKNNFYSKSLYNKRISNTHLFSI